MSRKTVVEYWRRASLLPRSLSKHSSPDILYGHRGAYAQAPATPAEQKQRVIFIGWKGRVTDDSFSISHICE